MHRGRKDLNIGGGGKIQNIGGWGVGGRGKGSQGGANFSLTVN